MAQNRGALRAAHAHDRPPDGGAQPRLLQAVPQVFLNIAPAELRALASPARSLGRPGRVHCSRSRRRSSRSAASTGATSDGNPRSACPICASLARPGHGRGSLTTACPRGPSSRGDSGDRGGRCAHVRHGVAAVAGTAQLGARDEPPLGFGGGEVLHVVAYSQRLAGPARETGCSGLPAGTPDSRTVPSCTFGPFAGRQMTYAPAELSVAGQSL